MHSYDVVRQRLQPWRIATMDKQAYSTRARYHVGYASGYDASYRCRHHPHEPSQDPYAWNPTGMGARKHPLLLESTDNSAELRIAAYEFAASDSLHTLHECKYRDPLNAEARRGLPPLRAQLWSAGKTAAQSEPNLQTRSREY